MAKKKTNLVEPMLFQSINPKWREYDYTMTRSYWKHVPNHNVKPKNNK